MEVVLKLPVYPRTGREREKAKMAFHSGIAKEKLPNKEWKGILAGFGRMMVLWIAPQIHPDKNTIPDSEGGEQ